MTGEKVRNGDDAMQLIADAMGRDEEMVVLSADRLDDSFFELKTGVAGDIVQKFVNYRMRLAIVGDISEHVAASRSFRDFVYESNRGRQLWFVADEAELAARNTARNTASPPPR